MHQVIIQTQPMKLMKLHCIIFLFCLSFLSLTAQDTLYLKNGSKFKYFPRENTFLENDKVSTKVLVNNKVSRKLVNYSDILYFVTKDTLELKRMKRRYVDPEVSLYRYLDTNGTFLPLKDFALRLKAIEKYKEENNPSKRKLSAVGLVVSAGRLHGIGNDGGSFEFDNELWLESTNSLTLNVEALISKKNAGGFGVKSGLMFTDVMVRNGFAEATKIPTSRFYFVLGPNYNVNIGKVDLIFKFFVGFINNATDDVNIAKITNSTNTNPTNTNSTTTQNYAIRSDYFSFLVNPSFDVQYPLSENISIFSSIGLMMYNSKLNVDRTTKNSSNSLMEESKKLPEYTKSNTMLDFRIGLKFGI